MLTDRSRGLSAWPVLTIALAGLGACAAPLPCDHEQATAIVERWVPRGTPVAEAQRTMVSHGFKCAVERDTLPALVTAESRRVDALECRGNWGWFDSRDYLVQFVLDRDDRVESIDARCAIATLWMP